MAGEHEEWRSVGASPAYEVSNLGRVRLAHNRRVKMPTRTATGSLVVNLYERGRGNVRAVHSLVAEAFLGPRKRGHMVQPLDRDKMNCAASNLEYVPSGMRTLAMQSDQGRVLTGKLNLDQAGEIKRRSRAGESVKDLAASFGVSSSLVSNIKHGKKWKDAQVSSQDCSTSNGPRAALSGPLLKSQGSPMRRPADMLFTLLDPDADRRLAVASFLSPLVNRLVAREELDHLMANWPLTGIILVHASGQLVAELQAAMRDAGKWRTHIAYGEAPSTAAVVEAVLGGAIDYLNWPADQETLQERMQLWPSRSGGAGRRELRKIKARRRLAPLSPRQLQILSLIAYGMGGPQIADALAISPRTIEIHRSNIIKKLGVPNIAAAVRVAAEAEVARHVATKRLKFEESP